MFKPIEYKLDDPQRVGHDEVHRLMTNLLSHEEFPAIELVMQYHESRSHILGVVPSSGMGNKSRAHPTASKPNQPSRKKAKDVPLEQMPPRT